VSTLIPPSFPARFQCVGGAVVTTTAAPGPVGRDFSLSCNGCGLTYSCSTAATCRNWRRTRGRRHLMSPAEVAHFEGLSWNVVHTVANQHAAQCRQTPIT